MALNYPYVIANDTPADANEVMSNFLAVRQYVNQEMLPRDGSVAMTGRLLLSADPTANNHAANKKYVDDATANGTVTTAKLADDAVIAAKIKNKEVGNAKLRDSAAASVIGRSATTAGVPADIAVAANRVLGRANTGGLVSTQVLQDMIENQAVSNAKLRNSAAASVIGRATTSSGTPADITVASNRVLGRTGSGNLGSVQVSTAMIVDGAVNEAKLDSGFAAAPAVSGWNSGLQCFRVGATVIVHGIVVRTGAATSDLVTAAEIPAGFRPATQPSDLAALSPGAPGGGRALRVNLNGTVQVNGANQNEVITITVVYRV